ncbi:MAG: DMT family transporter [Cyanobacteria bacterium J06627_28]
MSLKHWLLLCLPAFCWGSAFIFMEVALPVFSPLTIVIGRMCVGALVLSGVQFWAGKSRGEKAKSALQPNIEPFSIWRAPLSLWVQCAGLGITNTLLPFGLVVWAQQYITASLASILISVAPVFTVVLAVFLLGEKLTFSRFLGALLGFSGVVVLIGPSVLRGMSLQGAGELAILGAALCYSISGFWGRRFKDVPPQALSAMTITTGALIIGVIGVLVQTFGESPVGANVSVGAVLAVLGLGVFSTALAYIVYFHLLAEVGVVNTSLVSFLVPLCTLIMSTLFLQERLSSAALCGMALILLGLAVLDGRVLRKLF